MNGILEKLKEQMNFSESVRMSLKAHKLIPGGCHTYAKGDDQYPDQSPGFISRGEGSHVFDVDGNEFIEYGMGLRSVTLGHGNRRVAKAAYEATLQGVNFLRPSPLEVELAEEMLSLLPHGDMIKFGKNGSDVTSAAIRLARAYTNRDARQPPVFLNGRLVHWNYADGFRHPKTGTGANQTVQV